MCLHVVPGTLQYSMSILANCTKGQQKASCISSRQLSTLFPHHRGSDSKDLMPEFNKVVKFWNEDPTIELKCETKKAISNLRTHIKRGCLSYPQGSTSANGSFHRVLRATFPACRTIGQEFLVLRMMPRIYQYNNRMTLGDSCFENIRPSTFEDEVFSLWNYVLTEPVHVRDRNLVIPVTIMDSMTDLHFYKDLLASKVLDDVINECLELIILNPDNSAKDTLSIVKTSCQSFTAGSLLKFFVAKVAENVFNCIPVTIIWYKTSTICYEVDRAVIYC